MKLRRARLRDADFLLQLKNDPESLKWSWNHEPVSATDHLYWLKQALYFKEPRIYIAEFLGERVGTIRTEIKEGDEISFTVAPEYRGKGWGTEMLLQLPKRKGIRLVGYTDLENMASRRAFEKAGFKLYVMAVKE